MRGNRVNTVVIGLSPETMIEHKFSDLSQLTYRIFTIDRRVRHTVSLTILEWTGIYGHGFAWKRRCGVHASDNAGRIVPWHSHGVIFDLRNLHYEWGNGIWESSVSKTSLSPR